MIPIEVLARIPGGLHRDTMIDGMIEIEIEAIGDGSANITILTEVIPTNITRNDTGHAADHHIVTRENQSAILKMNLKMGMIEGRLGRTIS